MIIAFENLLKKELAKEYKVEPEHITLVSNSNGEVIMKIITEK